VDILVKSATALWQVIAVGLLLGAGLPALFSLGMRSLETGRVPAPAGASGGGPEGTVASTGGRVGAAVCFGLCVLAVVFGIVVIVFGKQLFS
jgi:hypothetical protein